MYKRSIRVMVSPAPATFAERRSILQVLERYGPVDMFRMSPVSLLHVLLRTVTRASEAAFSGLRVKAFFC